MTTHEWLDYLERKYTPPKVPPCVVCGAPLTCVASMADANPRTGDQPYEAYACIENSRDKDHYARSRVVFAGAFLGDERVVGLVRGYRAMIAAAETANDTFIK